MELWPYRLAVRTPGSHPGNPGSIPGGVTKKGFIFRSDLKQLVYLWWRAIFVGSKVYLFVGWKFVEYSTEKGGFSQWIAEVE